jgi:hypothetical protein
MRDFIHDDDDRSLVFLVTIHVSHPIYWRGVDTISVQVLIIMAILLNRQTFSDRDVYKWNWSVVIVTWFTYR